jgi:flagellin-specific chaperone FliS
MQQNAFKTAISILQDISKQLETVLSICDRLLQQLQQEDKEGIANTMSMLINYWFVDIRDIQNNFETLRNLCHVIIDPEYVLKRYSWALQG